MPRPQLPKVGLRTIKTALAVMISYAIFVPFDLIYHTEYGGIWGQLGPSYACIACIICMQSSLGQTIYQGVSRFIGVAVGGVLGILALKLGACLDHPAVKILMLGLVCVAGVWVCLLIKRPTACGMACILPCVILITNVSGSDRYAYAAARIVETVIGVAVAFVVNALLPSPQGEPEPDQSPQKKEKT